MNNKERLARLYSVKYMGTCQTLIALKMFYDEPLVFGNVRDAILTLNEITNEQKKNSKG